jgi:predicted nucleic acid-binding Zn ribbon protein
MSSRIPDTSASKRESNKVREIKWAPHKHCPVCGTPMSPNKTVCSVECEQLFEAIKEKRKRRNQLYYIILLPAIVILVIWILLQA